MVFTLSIKSYLYKREIDYLLFNLNFLKKILCIFIQKERQGEREGDKHQCVVDSHVPPTGNLAFNPGSGLGIKPVALWFRGWCSIH